MARAVGWAVAFLVGPCVALTAQELQQTDVVFQGVSNASAAVAIGADQVLVADDDDNRLRLYDVAGGAPKRVFDWSGELPSTGRNREADIEGAARIGDRIYWLGSHSRDKDGDLRPHRRRFFATDLITDAAGVALRPAGRPCAALLDELLRTEPARRLGLVEASRLSPDHGGLNFEGLARRVEGGLWVGVRSPLAGKEAILVPLLNPDDILAGAPPRFGEPVLLDLDGRGVRDLVLVDQSLYLIGGGAGSGRASRLYRWSPGGKQPQRLTLSLEKFNAEAVVAYDVGASPRLLLLADEGGQSNSRGTFRGRWFAP